MVDDIDFVRLIFQLLDENDDTVLGERRAVLEFGLIHSRIERSEG